MKLIMIIPASLPNTRLTIRIVDAISTDEFKA
jgi:hypothetical protein